ncbi:hypothetical protein MOO44_04425 [Nicoliella spurrieriana]|uniref:Uncharacterized protein n=1 Tax=Nicoliella spurrieriana TaxID=2925830 RepID=A0A976X6F8_9LACO|nr:hypothetical protein [Nicoliella spurrieriana]UQS87404.1 hypothetical protein MOO44_04425 [Nicoliella spurrieriana]
MVFLIPFEINITFSNLTIEIINVCDIILINQQSQLITYSNKSLVAAEGGLSECQVGVMAPQLSCKRDLLAVAAFRGGQV